MDERNERIAAAVALFAKDVGTWEVETDVRPPGAPGVQHRGEVVARVVAGRWLVADHRMDSGFEGHGVYGFDPDREVYVATWVDAAQTAQARGEGTWDADTRTMTFRMETTVRGQLYRYRETTETMADGHQVFRSFVPMPDGSEHAMITAVMRRR